MVKLKDTTATSDLGYPLCQMIKLLARRQLSPSIYERRGAKGDSHLGPVKWTLSGVKCQSDAVWQCNVNPMYFSRALLQQLICKWLSCGFVVQRVGSLVVLTDVAGRCCDYWGKKVNLVTSERLEFVLVWNMCARLCVCVFEVTRGSISVQRLFFYLKYFHLPGVMTL